MVRVRPELCPCHQIPLQHSAYSPSTRRLGSAGRPCRRLGRRYTVGTATVAENKEVDWRWPRRTGRSRLAGQCAGPLRSVGRLRSRPPSPKSWLRCSGWWRIRSEKEAKRGPGTFRWIIITWGGGGGRQPYGRVVGEYDIIADGLRVDGVCNWEQYSRR